MSHRFFFHVTRDWRRLCLMLMISRAQRIILPSLGTFVIKPASIRNRYSPYLSYVEADPALFICRISTNCQVCQAARAIAECGSGTGSAASVLLNNNAAIMAGETVIARMNLARLLGRVFNIECCLRCGGSLKIIAAVEEPPVIASILRHLRLSAQPCLATRVGRNSVSGDLMGIARLLMWQR
jgi:hypothetical protein